MISKITLDPVVSSVSIGASKEAIFLEEQFFESRKHSQDAASLGGKLKTVQEELFDTAEECKSPNWAGCESRPVVLETYQNAYRFVEALPWELPAPEVGVEPDGHLTLEWHHSPQRTLSVSISPEGKIYFASLVGNNKRHGALEFYGEIPSDIIDLIKTVGSGIK